MAEHRNQECFTHQKVTSKLVVYYCCKQIHQKQVACWRKRGSKIYQKISVYLLKEVSVYAVNHMQNLKKVGFLMFDFQNIFNV